MAIDLQCPAVTQTNQGVCISFPGGPTICVQTPDINATDFTVAKTLVGQASAALAPLSPIFSIIEAILSIKGFVDAVPDSLGPPPDPTALAQAVKEVAKKVGALLGLIPQVSVPKMIVDSLNVVLTALNGLIEELQIVLVQEIKIAAASDIAAQPGNSSLLSIIACAQTVIDIRKANINESMTSLNGFIATANLLIGLVPGAPTVPNLSDLADDTSEAIDQLQDAVNLLQSIISKIPVP